MPAGQMATFYMYMCCGWGDYEEFKSVFNNFLVKPTTSVSHNYVHQGNNYNSCCTLASEAHTPHYTRDKNY